jgi:putative ABC transport system substrate-binding protein
MIGKVNRRQFITLLGGTAAWPLAARAQHRLPTVGVLGVATSSAWQSNLAVFTQRLNELGWSDARTLAFEYRWAEGSSGRFPDLAAELVRLKVDVILTAGGAVPAAKQATTTIPIVFAVASDPVGTGLVTSLASPGGNVTGLSVQATDLSGKRVELLRELVPGPRRLVIMFNPKYSAAAHESNEVRAAARSLGFETRILEIRTAQDVGNGIGTLDPQADILYVCIDPLTDTEKIVIATSALTARIPTMGGFRESVQAGSQVFYGPNTESMFRRAAELVDKILRGTKPDDIPVEQATKFDLIVNVRTARALGLDVPAMLLARADEVIE